MRGNHFKRIEILESHLGQGSEAQLRVQRAWAKARAEASFPQYHELLMAHCRGEISKEEYQREMDELHRELDKQFPPPKQFIRDPEHERAAEFGRRVFGRVVNEMTNPKSKQRTWDAAQPIEEDETESPEVAEAPVAPVAPAPPQSVAPAPNGRRRAHPWAV